MGGIVKALEALLKLLRGTPKKVPPVQRTFPKKQPSCKQDCPDEKPPERKGGPISQQSKEELEKSKRKYERLLEEHKKKLEEYKADPYAHDNKDVLKNAPKELHPKIIQGRIKELEDQMRKQAGELQKIMDALRTFE